MRNKWRHEPEINVQAQKLCEVIDSQLRRDFANALSRSDVLLLSWNDALRIEVFEHLTGAAPDPAVIGPVGDGAMASAVPSGRARDAQITVGAIELNIVTFSLRRSRRSIRRLDIFDRASAVLYVAGAETGDDARALLRSIFVAFPSGAPAVHVVRPRTRAADAHAGIDAAAASQRGGAAALLHDADSASPEALAGAAADVLRVLAAALSVSVRTRVAAYDPRSEVLAIAPRAAPAASPLRPAARLACAATLGALALAAWRRAWRRARERSGAQLLL